MKRSFFDEVRCSSKSALCCVEDTSLPVGNCSRAVEKISFTNQESSIADHRGIPVGKTSPFTARVASLSWWGKRRILRKEKHWDVTRFVFLCPHHHPPRCPYNRDRSLPFREAVQLNSPLCVNLPEMKNSDVVESEQHKLLFDSKRIGLSSVCLRDRILSWSRIPSLF